MLSPVPRLLPFVGVNRNNLVATGVCIGKSRLGTQPEIRMTGSVNNLCHNGILAACTRLFPEISLTLTEANPGGAPRAPLRP